MRGTINDTYITINIAVTYYLCLIYAENGIKIHTLRIKHSMVRIRRGKIAAKNGIKRSELEAAFGVCSSTCALSTRFIVVVINETLAIK